MADELNKKSTAILILLVAFTILTIADLISTLRLGALVQYLEANPLYSYIGLPGIIGINILLLLAIYWLYKKTKSVNSRYYCILILVTITIVKLFVVANNIQVALDPPTIEQAMAVTTEMKMQSIKKFSYMAFVPYLISLISYLFFKIDHLITIKNKNQT